MKIEKKLILCSILAIAIGIATIMPLEYLMAAQAQIDAQQANMELPKVGSFSDVNVTYAYCNPNKISGNDTTTLYGANIEAVVNFTLTPSALTNPDAVIEYYQFAVSSDQGPIVNMTYYFAENPHKNIIIFIGPGIAALDYGLTTGPVPSNSQGLTYDPWNRTFTTGLVSNYIFGTDPSTKFQCGPGAYAAGVISFGNLITAGGSGTINEIGLFNLCSWYNGWGSHTMMTHDILSSGVAFVAGNPLVGTFAINI